MTSEELIGNLLNIGLFEEYENRSLVVYRGCMDHNDVVVTREIFISGKGVICEEWGARITCSKGEFFIESINPTPQEIWSFLFNFDEDKIDLGLNTYEITLKVESIEDKVYLEKYFERKGIFLHGTTLVPNSIKVSECVD